MVDWTLSGWVAYLPATKHKYCLVLGIVSCTTYPTTIKAAMPLESLVKLRPNGDDDAGALMISDRLPLMNVVVKVYASNGRYEWLVACKCTLI